MSRNCAHPSLIEACKRQYVGPTIAELGKEPHNRFSGVVSPNNHAMPRARNGVLGHHALPGFDIAKKEILLAVVTKLGAFREQRREHGISPRLDIHPERFPRATKRAP